ncbi:DNA repair protein, partial [Paenibacillus sp. EKM208P]
AEDAARKEEFASWEREIAVTVEQKEQLQEETRLAVEAAKTAKAEQQSIEKERMALQSELDEVGQKYEMAAHQLRLLQVQQDVDRENTEKIST